MSLFVVFIFGAVLLGAGGMLSPAWRTAQPRIALSATLCLALVTGGAVFYTEVFGWDTLVIDYMLFALLSGVVLGGTLSTAQARAEARGEQLADRDQGWPGPQDLAFLALVALVVVIPLFHLVAPLGTQGQVSAFHSLTTREAQSFTSLLPFAPAATAIVSPGFHALSAYLSLQLGHTIPLIQLSVSSVVVYLLVWLAYDFGAELRDKRLGRAMAIAQMLGFAIHLSSLDGHFSELLALLFAQAFLLYALRLLRQFNLVDLVAGGLMIGAVIYTSLTLSLIVLLGFLSLLCFAWLNRQWAVSLRSRLGLALGIPMVALVGIAPWLVNNLPHMLPLSPSPFTAEFSNLVHMTRDQGFLILPLAFWGIAIGLRESGITRFVSLLMLAWLLLVVESSLFGVIGSLLPAWGGLTNAPNLARHGVILPYTWFAGLALLQLWDTHVPTALKQRLRRSAYPLLALTAALIVVCGIGFQPLTNVVRPLLALPPSSITEADLAVMSWLRENTPRDSILLASDGDAWLPIFAERRAIDFRAVRYFEWDFVQVADVEFDDVDYVYVAAGGDAPLDLRLRLVFEQAEARVFEVLPSQD